jgi:hypothetical protein
MPSRGNRLCLTLYEQDMNSKAYPIVWEVDLCIRSDLILDPILWTRSMDIWDMTRSPTCPISDAFILIRYVYLYMPALNLPSIHYKYAYCTM